MTCPDDTATPADRPPGEVAINNYTELEPAFGVLGDSDHQRLSVGGIHLGAAAFAGLVVTTAAAYLSWLANVQVPPEVLVPTGTIVGTAVGYIFPSD